MPNQTHITKAGPILKTTKELWAYEIKEPFAHNCAIFVNTFYTVHLINNN
jgi:hypothetical protein